ncbi:MAG: GNAT family N-acetyltransferase [Candidatus Heimdallarchaeota archaeon]|nr:GNAT family N-acetyltransferase [Candidatus Heimdallarchaeota archaeon]
MKSIRADDFAGYLEIQFPVKVRLHQSYQILQLNLLIVDEDHRDKGIGSMVMNRIIQYSEINLLDVVVTPTDHFGSRLRRLKKFYKRFGFVRFRSNSYSMIRYCEF